MKNIYLNFAATFCPGTLSLAAAAIQFVCETVVEYCHTVIETHTYYDNTISCQKSRALIHDDVIKRKHFQRNWPFVRGIHRWPLDSPHKKPVTRSFDIYFICAWTNSWTNNRDAGDLRRHRTHYDDTLMNLVTTINSYLAKIPPKQVVTDLGRGNHVNSGSAWCRAGIIECFVEFKMATKMSPRKNNEVVKWLYFSIKF